MGPPRFRSEPTRGRIGTDDEVDDRLRDAVPTVGGDRSVSITAAKRAAWSIGTVSIVLLLAAPILAFVDRHAALPAAVSTYTWNVSAVLSGLVNIAVPAIGIVLASKRPENPIGWLFLAAGLSLGITAFGTTYAVHALLARPGSLPAGRAAAWLGSAVSAIAIGALAFLFLLFPTGYLRSSRWRPAAWFVGACVALLTIVSVVTSTLTWSAPFDTSRANGPAYGALLFVIAFLGSLLVGLVAVVVRFRGSVGDERLQLKWFATGAALVVASFVAAFFTSSCDACNPPVAISMFQSVAFVLLWSAIAIAVLKYRLYEIDVVISKAVVYGTLAVFITLVYVGLVVGVGTLVGHRGSPLLSAIAAAVIAVAFQPVRERGRRLANRLVYGKRATPYEVLGEFSARVGETLAHEDVLPRMAQTLAEGTGAARADVWLAVADELRDEASWPRDVLRFGPVHVSGDDVSAIDAHLATPVRHQGELLGAISISKPPSEPLTATEAKLATDLASQAGLVLRNARLTEELLARLEELRASRQRIVTAQDEARRRLERNIHDGAQQQLVALAVKGRLVDAMIGRDEAKAHELLAEIQVDMQDALENLRDLARGIYPPLLADQGLAAALRAQARKSPVPVTVTSDGISRYRAEAEAAVYFSVLEGLQNVAKYAGATQAIVRLGRSDEHLTFEVSDDGGGFDPAETSYGMGLQGIADRLAALDGTFEVRTSPGSGTILRGRVPV
jgi:signal transduction histidine kinase